MFILRHQFFLRSFGMEVMVSNIYKNLLYKNTNGSTVAFKPIKHALFSIAFEKLLLRDVIFKVVHKNWKMLFFMKTSFNLKAIVEV